MHLRVISYANVILRAISWGVLTDAVRTAWYCPTMRALLVLNISVFTQTFTNILRKCTTAHAKTTPWQETSRYYHATLRSSYAIIWRGPSRKIFKKFKNWHAQNSTPAWTYAEARGPTPVTYRQECYANATQMKPPTTKQLSVAWRSWFPVRVNQALLNTSILNPNIFKTDLLNILSCWYITQDTSAHNIFWWF